MGSALSGFWRSRGLLTDAQSWLERILALPGDAQPALRAQALNDLANVAADRGDYGHARTRYEASLALRHDLGDRRGIADVLTNLGLLASDQRDYGRARTLLEQSLVLQRELGDSERIAITLANLGIVAYSEGRLDEAVALLNDARLRFAAAGDHRRIGYALTHLGIVARRRGDLVASEATHEEALAWYRACQNAPGIAGALNNLGRVAADRGDIERARRRYEEALGLQREAGNDVGVSLVLTNLAELAREQGDLGQAVALFREGVSLRWAKRDGPATAESMVGMVGAVAAAGRAGHAARLLGATRALWAATQPEATTELPGDDRVATELRLRLGEERFAAMVAEGRALSAEMAVAEALAVILPSGVAPAQAEQSPAAPSSSDHAGLTARELDVLQLVAAGKTNAEIGGVLFISPYTAKTHVANLLGKLGVQSRAAASTWAAQRGLL